MATTSISIDINDNVNATAVDVRDALCTKFNYQGVNTNPAKLAFIKQVLSAMVKKFYIEQKGVDASLLASSTAISTATGADIT